MKHLEEKNVVRTQSRVKEQYESELVGLVDDHSWDYARGLPGCRYDFPGGLKVRGGRRGEA